MQTAALTNLLPAPNNRTTVLAENAINADIIANLNALVPESSDQVKELAKKFDKGSPERTAFAIWYFLRTRAHYVRDSSELQLIRKPSRFIHDTVKKLNSGDCKSFALFTVSILRSLGLPAFLRYAGYTPGAQQPSHVYAYTKDAKGNDIIIDGCYPFFNREKKFTYSKNFNAMKVAALSGLPGHTQKFLNSCSDEQLEQIMARLKRKRELSAQLGSINPANVVDGLPLVISAGDEIGKLSKAEKKARAQKRKKKALEGLKKFGRGIAFFTLGVGRGAYLALVALNVNAFATKFKKLMAAKGKNGGSAFDEKILPFWKKIGGTKKLLLGAIKKGAKHKPLFMSKKAKARYQKQFGVGSCEYIGDVQGINAIPVAAAAAAAIPIVAAIIPVMIKAFSSLGHKKEAGELAAQGKDMVEQGVPSERIQQAAAAPAGEDSLPTQADETTTGQDDVNGIGAFDYTELFQSLGDLAAKGVTALGGAIQKKAKKNPQLQQKIDKVAQQPDANFSDAYEKSARGKHSGSGGFMKYLPWIGGGVVLLGGATYLATRKRR